MRQKKAMTAQPVFEVTIQEQKENQRKRIRAYADALRRRQGREDQKEENGNAGI